MHETVSFWGLVLSFGLLAPPLAAMLWLRLPLVRETVLSTIRMVLQLLFVGLYLGVVFRYDNLYLTLGWLAAMLLVADASILRGGSLRFSRLCLPLLGSLVLGTLVSAGYILALVLFEVPFVHAQTSIPLCGMILGNCLKADVIGLRQFYGGIRTHEKRFHLALAQGATLNEAVRPYLADALHAALAPLVATMASTGLVALPGMMTGVILGGLSPVEAVKYQLVILLGILCGTAVTVVSAVLLSMRAAFTPYGLLDETIFVAGKKVRAQE